MSIVPTTLTKILNVKEAAMLILTQQDLPHSGLCNASLGCFSPLPAKPPDDWWNFEEKIDVCEISRKKYDIFFILMFFEIFEENKNYWNFDPIKWLSYVHFRECSLVYLRCHTFWVPHPFGAVSSGLGLSTATFIPNIKFLALKLT